MLPSGCRAGPAPSAAPLSAVHAVRQPCPGRVLGEAAAADAGAEAGAGLVPTVIEAPAAPREPTVTVKPSARATGVPTGSAACRSASQPAAADGVPSSSSEVS